MKCSLMSSSPAFFLVVVEVILVETPRRQGSAVAVKAAAMVEDEACSLHLGFPCSLNRLPEVGFAFLEGSFANMPVGPSQMLFGLTRRIQRCPVRPHGTTAGLGLRSYRASSGRSLNLLFSSAHATLLVFWLPFLHTNSD